MTYLSAANWADNNVSKDEFETFDDWYNFVVGVHFDGVDINRTGDFKVLMRDYWEREVGTFTDVEEGQVDYEVAQSEIREIDRSKEELYRDIQPERPEPIFMDRVKKVLGIKPKIVEPPLRFPEPRLPVPKVPPTTLPFPTPTATIVSKPSAIKQVGQAVAKPFKAIGKAIRGLFK